MRGNKAYEADDTRKRIEAEVIKVTSVRDMNFKRRIFTPREVATASPAFRALNSHESRSSQKNPIKKIGTNIIIEFQLEPQKPPISQISKSFRASALKNISS